MEETVWSWKNLLVLCVCFFFLFFFYKKAKILNFFSVTEKLFLLQFKNNFTNIKCLKISNKKIFFLKIYIFGLSITMSKHALKLY